MTKLLKCPFCGGAPRIIEETPNAYPDFQIFCICEAEPCFSVPKADRERAIAAWNTRAPTPATPGEDRVRESEARLRAFVESMVDALGPYPFLNGHGIVADAYAALAQKEE